ncbi:MAG: SPASM domain-containing protein [Theionarchaea archaeon]|nr:SPASM domain-containing protein [Theionarchaea archaeon]
MFPCLPLGLEHYLLGNIGTDTLKNMWTSPILDAFRDRKNAIPLGTRCSTSTFLNVCKGGCFMSSFHAFGELWGDPSCPLIRRMSHE